MIEESRDIKWFEWKYQISNLWNVKSFVNNNIKWKEYFKKPWINKDWYNYVMLKKDWKRINCLLHRLVLSSFLENIENKRTVNHKDWNKLNNILENLEWATDYENVTHYHKKSKNLKQIDDIEFKEDLPF